ncbi:hypothetical protein SESBI_09996 [Sesbania bispinosa]|nr:hypothetical protein SESBI_09996 [Sesbania bispinosa]
MATEEERKAKKKANAQEDHKAKMNTDAQEIGFVDGTIPMPTVDSPYLAHWMGCNAMAKGWLKSAMDKKVRSSVRSGFPAVHPPPLTTVDCHGADQEGRCLLSDTVPKTPLAYSYPRVVICVFVLGAYCSSTALQNFVRVAAATDKNLKKKCTADSVTLTEFIDRARIFKFLSGLNFEFDPIHIQILGKEKLPSLSEVFYTVRGEENRRTAMLDDPPIDGSALVSRKGPTKGSSTGKFSLKPARDDRWCTYCKKSGHTKETCF